MSSYIDHLECTVCGKSYPHEQLIGISPCCEKVLFARYDLAKLGREVDRDSLSSRTDSMWRYEELLPVDDPGNIVTLGEGGTPLIKSRNLAQKLGMKCEGTLRQNRRQKGVLIDEAWYSILRKEWLNK